MNISRPALALARLLTLILTAQIATSAEHVYRFDMGTANSPVAAEYQPVTADTVYSHKSGFGWLAATASREGYRRREISESVVWRHKPGASLVDGVASRPDLVFQVDVPNGDYTVEIQLGDQGGYIPAGFGRFLDTGVKGEASGGLGSPLFSMAVNSGDRARGNGCCHAHLSSPRQRGCPGSG